MDLNFNTEEHEDMSDFSILPLGWYLVVVSNTEQKASQSNPQSKYMSVTMDVVSEQMKGRKAFNNLNLWNTGPKAQEVIQMAQRELATMCRAMGKNGKIENSSELYNIPFGIKITHRKDKTSGEMRENIAAYCSEKEFAAKAAGNPTPTNPNAPSGGNAAPWSQ